MADDQWQNGPTTVQELAASGGNPPSRYVLREADRGTVSVVTRTAPIPAVDLSRLWGPEVHDEVETAKLRSAVQSWGLFLAVGHGIETSFLDELLNVSREFFCLPLEQKQKYTNLTDGKEFNLEGYGNDRVVAKDQILDWSDRLYLQVQPEDARKLSLWPTHPNSFRDILDEYTKKSKKVANNVLRNMAKLLELNENHFVNKFDETAVTFARFNYYPRCQWPDLVNGLKPHSDGSVITILLLDKDVGGLQVLRDGLWYNVPTVPYSLLVNVGDAMEILSNGYFNSPVHRVVTNSEKERLSVVMFYSLDPETELEPAEELVNEKRPRSYRKVKTKDYLVALFENFAQGKRAIDTVRI